MKRRRLLWAVMLASLSAAGAGHAADLPAATRRYSVLSLVGDQLDVVTYRPGTGSNRDANAHNAVALRGGVFDKAALLAAERALTRVDRTASVQLLAVSEPGGFDRQHRFFDDGKLVLPTAIDTAVRADGATHLVLITKYRAEARLQAADQSLGTGTLEGLGFYIDNAREMRSTVTGELSIGFLAPFAYVRFSLVDLQSSAIVRQRTTAASTVVGASRAKQGLSPWDALDPAEKVNVLRRLLSDEVEHWVPEVVAAGG